MIDPLFQSGIAARPLTAGRSLVRRGYRINLEARIQNPEARSQKPEARIQKPEFRIQNGSPSPNSASLVL
jgi:hypothetical protein